VLSFLTYGTAEEAEQAYQALQGVAWQEEGGRAHWVKAQFYNAEAAAAARRMQS
jgi:hypothetical protein